MITVIRVNFMYDVWHHQPAMGAPTNEVIPWHRTIIPKALVSLSKPMRSTSIMERRDTKQAEIKENRHRFI